MNLKNKAQSDAVYKKHTLNIKTQIKGEGMRKYAI